MNEKSNQIDQRKLVGKLNRKLGFNGCEKVFIGEPVYENNGLYEVDFKKIGSDEVLAIKWYKDKFKENIDFDC